MRLNYTDHRAAGRKHHTGRKLVVRAPVWSRAERSVGSSQELSLAASFVFCASHKTISKMPTMNPPENFNQQAAPPDWTKTCPSCQMKVSPKAMICPYCRAKLRATAGAKAFLALLLFILAVIIIGAVSNSSQETPLSPPPPQAISTTTAPTPTITPSNQPVSVPKTWHQVATFSGSASKDTAPFLIKGEKWRMRWWSAGGGIGFFQAFVYDDDSITSCGMGPLTGKGSDVSYCYKSGEFHLKIISDSSYNIIVEDYSSENTSSQTTPSPKAVAAQQDDPAYYVKSVVQLYCPNSLGANLLPIGSGTFIDKRGYILTNFHIIGGIANRQIYYAPKCTVFTATSDNLSAHLPTYTAVPVSILKNYDIALLRVVEDANGSLISPPFDVVPLQLNNALPSVGGTVYALGYPDTGDNTLVLASGKFIGLVAIKGKNMIGIDAAIGPGNSGGALLDDKGHFIGIPTYLTQQENTEATGLAIANSDISNLVDSVIKNTGNLSSQEILDRHFDFVPSP
jgi:S1-C subfamily serine protease